MAVWMRCWPWQGCPFLPGPAHVSLSPCPLHPEALHEIYLPKHAALQQGVKLENMVTLGATLLSNATESYASFAVLVDQSLGRAVSPSQICTPIISSMEPFASSSFEVACAYFADQL